MPRLDQDEAEGEKYPAPARTGNENDTRSAAVNTNAAAPNASPPPKAKGMIRMTSKENLCGEQLQSSPSPSTRSSTSGRDSGRSVAGQHREQVSSSGSQYYDRNLEGQQANGATTGAAGTWYRKAGPRPAEPISIQQLVPSERGRSNLLVNVGEYYQLGTKVATSLKGILKSAEMGFGARTYRTEVREHDKAREEIIFVDTSTSSESPLMLAKVLIYGWEKNPTWNAQVFMFRPAGDSTKKYTEKWAEQLRIKVELRLTIEVVRVPGKQEEQLAERICYGTRQAPSTKFATAYSNILKFLGTSYTLVEAFRASPLRPDPPGGLQFLPFVEKATVRDKIKVPRSTAARVDGEGILKDVVPRLCDCRVYTVDLNAEGANTEKLAILLSGNGSKAVHYDMIADTAQNFRKESRKEVLKKLGLCEKEDEAFNWYVLEHWDQPAYVVKDPPRSKSSSSLTPGRGSNSAGQDWTSGSEMMWGVSNQGSSSWAGSSYGRSYPEGGRSNDLQQHCSRSQYQEHWPQKQHHRQAHQSQHGGHEAPAWAWGQGGSWNTNSSWRSSHNSAHGNAYGQHQQHGGGNNHQNQEWYVGTGAGRGNEWNNHSSGAGSSSRDTRTRNAPYHEGHNRRYQ